MVLLLKGRCAMRKFVLTLSAEDRATYTRELLKVVMYQFMSYDPNTMQADWAEANAWLCMMIELLMKEE